MYNSGKRKIILVGPAYPYRGGPSTFVSYIYKSLQNDFLVKVYNYKLLYPDFLFPGSTQFDKSQENKFIVPSERIINSINPFNWIKTASMIKRENADLVIFDWWHPFFGPCHYSISKLIKRKYGKRILFITENFISHEENKIDHILTNLGLSKSGAFLALSSTVEEELKKNFPGKKVYRSELPSFDLYSDFKEFDREKCRAELDLSDKDKVLLFFGYVRKYKGLDVLIRALPLIKKKIPEIKLLIVGEFYDKVENYTDLMSELGIANEILLINKFVSNEEVGKYYTASDLNILPYRSATQSAVLNVSYSFKKPVVATNVGGLSEFITDGKTGIIVEPDSPEKLAGGVLKFFELNTKIDFSANITKMAEENKFNDFPLLMETICRDLS